MSDLDIPSGSPFDAIKRVDERGEHWFARELMPLLGYGADWRNFADVIEKGKRACEGSEVPAQDHFGDVTKMVPLGSGAFRPVPDFRLTRYAAYLVAQNGDSRKKAVAEAQTYFAVRTHEAETRSSALPALPDFSALGSEALAYLGQVGQALASTSQALMLEQAKIAEQAKELEAARSKVEFVDTFISPTSDITLFRTFAEQIDQPEQALRKYLMVRKVIYRTVVSYRGKKRTPEYEYHAYATHKEWFHPKDQPEAPRLPGGRMRTTLYVTALGKVRIGELLKRRPLHLLAVEEAS